MIATKDGLELSNGAHVVKDIPLGEIRTDRTQSRAARNEETVSEYAELLESGVVLPPVDVFFDGREYWLADGFHRYAAAESLGHEEMECIVHEGSMRDALAFSLGANARHGLRRTNADKRRAVEIALGDGEWRSLSDREIGRLCGVSNTLVSNMKHAGQVSTVDTSEARNAPDRLRADAKLRPATRKQPVTRISGGTSFDIAEIEAAPARKPAANGASVLDGKAVQIALKRLSELVRLFKHLELLDEFEPPLSQMLVRVKQLKNSRKVDFTPEEEPKPQPKPVRPF